MLYQQRACLKGLVISSWARNCCAQTSVRLSSAVIANSMILCCFSFVVYILIDCYLTISKVSSWHFPTACMTHDLWNFFISFSLSLSFCLSLDACFVLLEALEVMWLFFRVHELGIIFSFL